MKRILNILLVAILVVTTLSTVAAAKEVKPGETVDIKVTVSGEFANYLIDIKANEGLAIQKITTDGAGGSVITGTTTAKANWASSSNVTSHSITVTVMVVNKLECDKSYNVTATAVRADKYVDMAADNDGIADGFIRTSVSVSGGSIYFDHEWDDGVVTTNPTCTEAGIKTLTCTICGETDTEPVPATGHKAGNWETSKPATCTAAGEQVKKCTVCQKVVDRKVIDALGHDEDNMVEIERVDPTCTEDGYVKSKCPRCDDYVKTDILDALGHDYDVKTTTATCTEGGITTYVCKRCGHTYTDDATSALGHDYKLVDSKAATCTEAGFENYECSRCKDTYTTELKALGHQWCENFDCEHEHEHYDEEYHWFLCLICGEKKDAERHNHIIEKEGYLFCKCGHWIEVDEPGIDPEPKPGDYSFVMYAGIAALIAMMAAAAYVYKRKMAN